MGRQLLWEGSCCGEAVVGRQLWGGSCGEAVVGRQLLWGGSCWEAVVGRQLLGGSCGEAVVERQLWEANKKIYESSYHPFMGGDANFELRGEAPCCS